MKHDDWFCGTVRIPVFSALGVDIHADITYLDGLIIDVELSDSFYSEIIFSNTSLSMEIHDRAGTQIHTWSYIHFWKQ